MIKHWVCHFIMGKQCFLMVDKKISNRYILLLRDMSRGVGNLIPAGGIQNSVTRRLMEHDFPATRVPN